MLYENASKKDWIDIFSSKQEGTHKTAEDLTQSHTRDTRKQMDHSSSKSKDPETLTRRWKGRGEKRARKELKMLKGEEDDDDEGSGTNGRLLHKSERDERRKRKAVE